MVWTSLGNDLLTVAQETLGPRNVKYRDTGEFK